MIREAKSEVEILLDKHNGHGLLRPQIGDNLANLRDDVGLDTLCRLIKQKKLRLCDSVLLQGHRLEMCSMPVLEHSGHAQLFWA